MTDVRQRWRLLVRRDASARDTTHRDVADAWESALEASGLPLARSEGERPRPKLTFAAPLPVGLTAEREPMEFALTERTVVSVVRTSIERVIPAGHGLVDLFDVWVGAPPISGQVVAADYAVVLEEASERALRAAVAAVLGMRELVRERTRGDKVRRQDLRPLIDRLVLTGSAAVPSVPGPAAVPSSPLPAAVPSSPAVSSAAVTSPAHVSAATRAEQAAPQLALLMRLRHDPERGVGRPDEVLAALSDVAGMPFVPTEMTRRRVWLAEDAGPDGLPPLAPVDARSRQAP